MESVDKWMGKRGLSKKLRMRIGQHYQEVCVPELQLALHRAADNERASLSLSASPKLTVKQGCLTRLLL